MPILYKNVRNVKFVLFTMNKINGNKVKEESAFIFFMPGRGPVFGYLFSILLFSALHFIVQHSNIYESPNAVPLNSLF